MIQRNYFAIVCFIFVMIQIQACQENNESKATSISEKELNLFSTSLAENKFNASSDAEQWKLLAEVAKKKYSNTPDVKNWLGEKVKLKLQNPKALTTELLRELMYTMFNAEYLDEASTLAYFALYSKWGKRYNENKDVSALVLSNYYALNHELDSLIKYNDILGGYVEQESDSILQINFYMNQAEIEEKNGDFFHSVLHYYKALDFIPQTDSVKLAIVYHNLAVTYLNLEYFDKSLEYLNLSINYSSINDLSLYKLNTAGIIYSKSNAYDQAEEIFQTAIDVAKKEGQNALLAQSYANYGNLKRKQKNFSKALEYMLKSDSICLTIGLDFGILINYINRAEVYLDQGLHRTASDELEKARQSIDHINDVKLNKEFYNLYHRIQDAIGNKAEANFYYRLYNEYKNEYFGDLSKTIIVEWLLENQKNQALKKESEYELSLEKKNRDILFISFLLLLAALASIITYFILFRRNVREKKELELEKQKMAYELEIKSKELLADTIKNISISSLKNNIYVELTSIVKELPKTHQNKLTNLANKIKQTSKLSELDEFNQRFTQIYEGFYYKLREIAPEITPSELNICALIRLNLTSKEIALLTNRTERTVENIRVNIRKKLKLSPESNLQKELWNIN